MGRDRPRAQRHRRFDAAGHAERSQDRGGLVLWLVLVVRKATEIGLHVPANEFVDRLVRTIEAGELRAGPENLPLLVGLGDG